MKKLIFICLFSFFTAITAYAQFFQWAKKQDKSYINNQPQSPLNITPVGGNFLAGGNKLVAQTGLFTSTITFANQTLVSADSIDAYLAVHDLTGNLLWAKQIGGSTYRQPSVAVDKNDNIIITGAFYDSLRIGSLLLKSTTITKAGVYTVKLDPAGNMLWARSSELSNNSLTGIVSETAISTDAAGNVFIAGTFNGNLAFNGTNLVSVAGQNNIYVVKYSANGVLQWAKTPAINGLGINITADPAGNVVVSTSPHLQNVMQHQLTKLDQNGNITWAKIINTWPSLGINLTSDNIGNIYLTGYLSGTNTIGNSTITVTNSSGCFLAKLDPAGNWKWVRKIADNLQNLPWTSFIMGEPQISFSATNHIAIAGLFTGSAQFTGFSLNLSPGASGTFVLRADTAGTINWVNSIRRDSASVSSYTEPTGIATDPKGSFYVSGNLSGKNHFGPISLNTNATQSSFLTKVTNESNLIAGKIFIDANNNGIYDTAENPFPELILGNGQGIINSISTLDGTYKIYTPTGNTLVSIANPPRHYVITPASHAISFTGLNQTQSGKDFALQPLPNSNDVSVIITPNSGVRLGRTFNYRLTFKNYGTTILSDTLKFNFNTTDISYVSSSVAPLNQSTGKLAWYYQNLQPNETRNIDVTFLVSTNSVVGTPLTANATIKPLGIDLFPSDNTFTITHPITGPYDPNDKQVDKPFISPAAAVNGEYLDYTIRFQNIGTDTAFTVIVTDDISAKLEMGQFEMLSASHPFKLSLNNNNQLEWRFDNILLPHSTRNEPASHGFVRFRIKTKPGLVLGDSIANNAAIYFDYNAPVITNYAVTKVANPLGIKDTKGEFQDFKIYPNPARSYVIIAAEFKKDIISKIRLVNMLGQVISETNLPANNQIHYQMPLQDLPKGIYIIQLETGTGVQAKRLVVQ